MPIDHSQVLKLLPWYVTGTLSGEESESVRSHIGQCLPCRAAYRHELQLHSTFAANGAVPIGEDRGLSDLLARIEHSGNGARRVARGLRTPGYALVAAGLAVVALGAIAFLPLPGGLSEQGSFSTLFDDSAVSAPRADVIFARTPSPEELSRFLEEFGAVVTAGPTALGRYTVEFESTSDVESVLDRLRADTRVRFAGRNFVNGGSDIEDVP